MASITPIVRQSSWFLAIPQFVVLGIFMLLWYPISPESFWGLGALCYLVISKVLRFYIPKDHREGLKKVKLQKFDEAIPHFQKSYDYFKLHYWIDSYRSIVLLSSSRMCYKEMALNNIGFCYGQIGNGEMAKKYYELTLLEFPESEIAKTALRFMDSVSSS